MSATAAPFGLAPIMHPSGLVRPSAYPGGIESAYNTALYNGAPVKLGTAGYLLAATVNEDWLGRFDGVEFTDSSGLPRVNESWPASQVATQITAYVHDDPAIEYQIQSDGTLAQSSIGDQGDFVNPGSGNSLGFSTASINHTLGGVGVQKQMRILGLMPLPNNAWDDAYTIVVVQNARHQYVANKVAV